MPRSLTSSRPLALGWLQDTGFDLILSSAGATSTKGELLRLAPSCVAGLASVQSMSESAVPADWLRIVIRDGTRAFRRRPSGRVAFRSLRHECERNRSRGTDGRPDPFGLPLFRETARGIREGGWPRLKGREIDETTVGIVGPGAIGRRVARVLNSLIARIVGPDPLRPDTGGLPMDYVGPGEPLGRSEVVTLHCPFPTDGHPLLDRLALARLPRGATLANTARTNLLDVRALFASLGGGQIETCAPDVFATGLPEDDPLAAYPRVIATSHNGALTEANVTCANEVAVENLLLGLRGPAHAPG